MRFRGWEIVISRGPAAATVVAAIVFGLLGWWQLDRAAQKRAIEAIYRERSLAAPLDLNAALAPCAHGSADWRQVLAEGRWAPEHQILLDNVIAGGRVGYRVFTLFKLAGSAQGVLVDRGWVPAPPYRELAPFVDLDDDEAVVHGIAAPAPPAGLGIEADPDASLGKGLFRVERIDLPALAGVLGVKLLPCTIRLDPEATDGYLRDWPAPGANSQRHIAYAIQWFAFGVTAIGLYLLLHVHRVREP